MSNEIRVDFDDEMGDANGYVDVRLHTYTGQRFDFVMDMEQFIEMNLGNLKAQEKSLTFSWFDTDLGKVCWFEIHPKDVLAIGAVPQDEKEEEEGNND